MFIYSDDIKNSHRIFTVIISKTHTQNIYSDDIKNSHTEYLQ